MARAVVASHAMYICDGAEHAARARAAPP
eukprot:COSAG05_NODE_3718_length_1884_cov_1.939530_3_plen_28_part_01